MRRKQHTGKKNSGGSQKGPVHRNPPTKAGTDPLYKHGRMVETFNCILNKGREDSPATNQETTAQEPAAWIPFTTNEVRDIIDATKRKKVAGPDKIYNEYLNDTAQ